MAEHKDLILCECYSTDHQIIFLYDDDPEWNSVYLHVHLNPDRGFWKRVINGIKYIFGYRSKYGAFDEMVISPKDAEYFQKIADKLKDLQ